MSYQALVLRLLISAPGDIPSESIEAYSGVFK